MNESAIKPTYTAEIDGRRLAVYDGLLPAQMLSRFFAATVNAAFKRTEIARPDTAAVRHWACEVPLQALPELPFDAPTRSVLADYAPGHRYRIYRAYINASTFGDMLFTHTDAQPGSQELTVLWYVNEFWDAEWGGETLFFDKQMDARAVVSPRPGRIAIFDGQIVHAGRPPNRVCHESRFTLAFKLERLDG